MKAYWDSSALVVTVIDNKALERLKRERGFARTHSLAETFSALTGRLTVRMSANSAAKTLKAISGHLDFVDLSPAEVLDALEDAKSIGVMGGRVHDYLHALAAAKCGSVPLLTMDRSDFSGLVPGLVVEQI